jgi:hypothetical protein
MADGCAESGQWRLDRRSLLAGAGSVIGLSLLGRPAGGTEPPLLLDFRGRIPREVSFRRASQATLVDEPGRVQTLAADVPRFPQQDGKVRGLLIDGPTDGQAADEVTFPARLLQSGQGCLTVGLPDGGRRDGVVLDTSNGAEAGIRIAYSTSGWVMASIGRVRLIGCCDVTKDGILELRWSPDGAQIATGQDVDDLTVRAASRTDPLPIDCGKTARLGMTVAGKRPLSRIFATVAFARQAGPIAAAALPVFVPSGYRLVFGDDFDDADVGRINENATGGRAGAPAWRSRYRQSRQEVTTQEKQIFMDPAFAGTADHPLGVQPFSIADGVLRIRADGADPVKVSRFIWNYRYTSGCITSEYTHVQKYGYFEMRAKLPLGRGFWPGFWLLARRKAWPPEIDVFEGFGTRPTTIHQGVIERIDGRRRGTGAWVRNIFDVTTAFHCYGLEWTESKFRFFLDGTQSNEYDNHVIHEEMYILANLSLGSHDPNYVPDPDESTPLPGFLEIDYIRAYSRA